VISGFAGVGKTSLAVHWAHSVRERFPDGQLYVNLLGFTPTGSPLTPAEAIRCVLDSYFDADRIPSTEQGRANLYRSVLANRRAFLLLDNARDVDQVRPLLPHGSGCLVLVTSRSRLSALADTSGVALENLELLPKQHAQELLVRRLGPERHATEGEDLGAIADLCSRLPLALSIIAARAAERPSVPLAEFRAELSRGGARLDALDAGGAEANVRAAISWTFRQLGPAEQRLFRLLGLQPGEELATSVEAAAALTGGSITETRRSLGELVRAQMLADLRPGWFTAHDLLREYSVDEARTNLSDEERRAAFERLCAYYLFTANSGALALRPTRETIDLPELPPGVEPRTLLKADALQWFTAEHRNLKALVLSAADDAYGWKIAWSLLNYLDWQGYWDDLKVVESAGLEAARRSGSTLGEALCLRYLGGAHALLREFPEARACLLAAYVLSEQVGDRPVQARILMNLGWAAEEEGSLADAVSFSQRSFALFEDLQNDAGQANALYALGRCMHKNGSVEGARQTLADSLEIFHRIDDAYGEAGANAELGRVHQNLGDPALALEFLERSRAAYAAMGARRDLANVLIYLGDARAALGQEQEASNVWQEALEVLCEINHPDVAEAQARLDACSRGTDSMGASEGE